MGKTLNMKRNLIYILLAALFMSCICAGGRPNVEPAPVNNYKYMFIFNGESNSGGQALNTPASVSELSPKYHVQILNNNTMSFEDLHIGVNNTIGHTGIACCTMHGWELELANRTALNTSFYGDTVYLVKTGQGGSKLQDWNVVCGAYCDTSLNYIGYPYYRIRKADSLLSGQNIRKVIFLSIGINDLINNTNNDSVRIQMARHIGTLRAITRENTPVVITKFWSEKNRYNNVIDSVANNMGLTRVYTVEGTAELGDQYHWNYNGMKTIATRLFQVVENNITW